MGSGDQSHPTVALMQPHVPPSCQITSVLFYPLSISVRPSYLILFLVSVPRVPIVKQFSLPQQTPGMLERFPKCNQLSPYFCQGNASDTHSYNVKFKLRQTLVLCVHQPPSTQISSPLSGHMRAVLQTSDERQTPVTHFGCLQRLGPETAHVPHQRLSFYLNYLSHI